MSSRHLSSSHSGRIRFLRLPALCCCSSLLTEGYAAIDLNKGEIAWQVVLGEHKELMARGIAPTGTQNIGGSVVTAGGLLFIGAETADAIQPVASARF